MEVARLVLEYVKVLAWPVVVLIVLFAARHRLADILGRLTSGEVDALGVKLRLDIDQARRAAEVERLGQDPSDDTEALDLVREEFSHFFDDIDKPMADLPQPQAAVVRAYLGLLSTVGKSAQLLGVAATSAEASAGKGSYPVEVARLRAAGIIDEALQNALRALDAVYAGMWAKSLPVDESMATSYTGAAVAVSEVIAANTLHELKVRAEATAS